MSKRKYRNLRWAACLATIVTALFGASAAQAGTGGASAFTAPAPPPSAVSSTGAEGLAFSPWRSGGASWYGPGLYGNRTACGQVLRSSTVGVAHKTLPCGTAVKFFHRGHVLVTRVIDRGPYLPGRAWDLTEAASEALDFESVGVGQVRYAVATSYARQR